MGESSACAGTQTPCYSHRGGDVKSSSVHSLFLKVHFVWEISPACVSAAKGKHTTVRDLEVQVGRVEASGSPAKFMRHPRW